jgi:hypothetical protein
MECLAKLLRKLEANKYMPYYQEYLAFGEEIRATFPFKKYCILLYRSWPKDLYEDYFKITGKEVKKDKHGG